jgi:hypothetical protein
MKSFTVYGWFFCHLPRQMALKLTNSRATTNGDHFCLRKRKICCVSNETAYVVGVAWLSSPTQQTGNLKFSVSRSNPDAFEDSAWGCTSHEFPGKVSEILVLQQLP